MDSSLVIFVSFFFLFLMSVVLHELGHAGAALWCGDPTARDLGRITLNPIAHIDPVWTLLMPVLTTIFMGLPFGGAKPVPVNPLNFRNPRRDDLIVTLAGPAANIAQALIYVALFHLVFGSIPPDRVVENGLGAVVVGMVFVNFLLAFFNLLPVPPLDGSHVVAALMPAEMAAAYRSVGFFGILILLVLLRFTGLSDYLSFGTLWTIDLLGVDYHIVIDTMKVLQSLPGQIGL